MIFAGSRHDYPGHGVPIPTRQTASVRVGAGYVSFFQNINLMFLRYLNVNVIKLSCTYIFLIVIIKNEHKYFLS